MLNPLIDNKTGNLGFLNTYILPAISILELTGLVIGLCMSYGLLRYLLKTRHNQEFERNKHSIDSFFILNFAIISFKCLTVLVQPADVQG